jgi:predicted O-methyltransferase YrrM
METKPEKVLPASCTNLRVNPATGKLCGSMQCTCGKHVPFEMDLVELKRALRGAGSAPYLEESGAWLLNDFASYFPDSNEALGYKRDLENSSLMERLETIWKELKNQLRGSVRGRPMGPGAIDLKVVGANLYHLVRKIKPRIAVETGVCNGFSSAFILLAMKHNGGGVLHSIDLPEMEGQTYEIDHFWEGKMGAVVPREKQPGWVIPSGLRANWELTLGKSTERLKPLLERLGSIDFFLHDSEHSYQCMSFEFRTAYVYLREGGVLASDDILANSAFSEFVRSKGKTATRLGGHTGFFIK